MLEGAKGLDTVPVFDGFPKLKGVDVPVADTGCPKGLAGAVPKAVAGGVFESDF